MGIVEKYLRGRVELSKVINVDPTLNDQALNAAIAFNKYGAYCVPVSAQHRVLARKILRGEIFEPDTIEFMRTHAKDGDIIHAGSFFGDFFPGLSTAMAPGSFIWSFEPNRESFRCAQMTILLNNISNIKLFPCGLGEKDDRAHLKTNNHKGVALGGASTISSSKEKKGVWTEIAIEAIDEMVPETRHISILQLDVEGYEEQALKGALATIKRCKPILILEDDHKITRSEWFKSTILPLGYQVSEKLHYNRIVLPIS